ncbi:ERAD-associated E3 ubiquitin-protein ligase DOA10-like, partial [Cicer arietinum]
MQLASNSDKDECSECEPILNHQASPDSFSCEIIPANSDDLQNVRVDESSPLINGDQPQCRICLDLGGEDLIAPCHCKGTQKYVHRSCLDNWRSTK